MKMALYKELVTSEKNIKKYLDLLRGEVKNNKTKEGNVSRQTINNIEKEFQNYINNVKKHLPYENIELEIKHNLDLGQIKPLFANVIREPEISATSELQKIKPSFANVVAKPEIKTKRYFEKTKPSFANVVAEPEIKPNHELGKTKPSFANVVTKPEIKPKRDFGKNKPSFANMVAEPEIKLNIELGKTKPSFANEVAKPEIKPSGELEKTKPSFVCEVTELNITNCEFEKPKAKLVEEPQPLIETNSKYIKKEKASRNKIAQEKKTTSGSMETIDKSVETINEIMESTSRSTQTSKLVNNISEFKSSLNEFNKQAHCDISIVNKFKMTGKIEDSNKKDKYNKDMFSIEDRNTIEKFSQANIDIDKLSQVKNKIKKSGKIKVVNEKENRLKSSQLKENSKDLISKDKVIETTIKELENDRVSSSCPSDDKFRISLNQKDISYRRSSDSDSSEVRKKEKDTSKAKVMEKNSNQKENFKRRSLEIDSIEELKKESATRHKESTMSKEGRKEKKSEKSVKDTNSIVPVTSRDNIKILKKKANLLHLEIKKNLEHLERVENSSKERIEKENITDIELSSVKSKCEENNEIFKQKYCDENLEKYDNDNRKEKVRNSTEKYMDKSYDGKRKSFNEKRHSTSGEEINKLETSNKNESNVKIREMKKDFNKGNHSDKINKRRESAPQKENNESSEKSNHATQINDKSRESEKETHLNNVVKRRDSTSHTKKHLEKEKDKANNKQIKFSNITSQKCNQVKEVNMFDTIESESENSSENKKDYQSQKCNKDSHISKSLQGNVETTDLDYTNNSSDKTPPKTNSSSIFCSFSSAKSSTSHTESKMPSIVNFDNKKKILSSSFKDSTTSSEITSPIKSLKSYLEVHRKQINQSKKEKNNNSEKMDNSYYSAKNAIKEHQVKISNADPEIRYLKQIRFHPKYSSKIKENIRKLRKGKLNHINFDERRKLFRIMKNCNVLLDNCLHNYLNSLSGSSSLHPKLLYSKFKRNLEIKTVLCSNEKSTTSQEIPSSEYESSNGNNSDYDNDILKTNDKPKQIKRSKYRRCFLIHSDEDEEGTPNKTNNISNSIEHSITQSKDNENKIVNWAEQKNQLQEFTNAAVTNENGVDERLIIHENGQCRFNETSKGNEELQNKISHGARKDQISCAITRNENDSCEHFKINLKNVSNPAKSNTHIACNNSTIDLIEINEEEDVIFLREVNKNMAHFLKNSINIQKDKELFDKTLKEVYQIWSKKVLTKFLQNTTNVQSLLDKKITLITTKLCNIDSLFDIFKETLFNNFKNIYDGLSLSSNSVNMLDNMVKNYRKSCTDEINKLLLKKKDINEFDEWQSQFIPDSKLKSSNSMDERFYKNQSNNKQSQTVETLISANYCEPSGEQHNLTTDSSQSSVKLTQDLTKTINHIPRISQACPLSKKRKNIRIEVTPDNCKKYSVSEQNLENADRHSNENDKFVNNESVSEQNLEKADSHLNRKENCVSNDKLLNIHDNFIKNVSVSEQTLEKANKNDNRVCNVSVSGQNLEKSDRHLNKTDNCKNHSVSEENLEIADRHSNKNNICVNNESEQDLEKADKLLNTHDNFIKNVSVSEQDLEKADKSSNKNDNGVSNLSVSEQNLKKAENQSNENDNCVSNVSVSEQNLEKAENQSNKNENGVYNVSGSEQNLEKAENQSNNNDNGVCNVSVSKQNLEKAENQSNKNDNGVCNVSVSEQNLEKAENQSNKNDNGVYNVSVSEQNLEKAENQPNKNDNGVYNVSVSEQNLEKAENQSNKNDNGICNVSVSEQNLEKDENQSNKNDNGVCNVSVSQQNLEKDENQSNKSDNGVYNVSVSEQILEKDENQSNKSDNGVCNVSVSEQNLEKAVNQSNKNDKCVSNVPFSEQNLEKAAKQSSIRDNFIRNVSVTEQILEKVKKGSNKNDNCKSNGTASEQNLENVEKQWNKNDILLNNFVSEQNSEITNPINTCLQSTKEESSCFNNNYNLIEDEEQLISDFNLEKEIKKCNSVSNETLKHNNSNIGKELKERPKLKIKQVDEINRSIMLDFKNIPGKSSNANSSIAETSREKSKEILQGKSNINNLIRNTNSSSLAETLREKIKDIFQGKSNINNLNSNTNSSSLAETSREKSEEILKDKSNIKNLNSNTNSSSLSETSREKRKEFLQGKSNINNFNNPENPLFKPYYRKSKVVTGRKSQQDRTINNGKHHMQKQAIMIPPQQQKRGNLLRNFCDICKTNFRTSIALKRHCKKHKSKIMKIRQQKLSIENGIKNAKLEMASRQKKLEDIINNQAISEPSATIKNVSITNNSNLLKLRSIRFDNSKFVGTNPQTNTTNSLEKSQCILETSHLGTSTGPVNKIVTADNDSRHQIINKCNLKTLRLLKPNNNEIIENSLNSSEKLVNSNENKISCLQNNNKIIGEINLAEQIKPNSKNINDLRTMRVVQSENTKKTIQKLEPSEKTCNANDLHKLNVQSENNGRSIKQINPVEKIDSSNEIKESVTVPDIHSKTNDAVNKKMKSAEKIDHAKEINEFVSIPDIHNETNDKVMENRNFSEKNDNPKEINESFTISDVHNKTNGKVILNINSVENIDESKEINETVTIPNVHDETNYKVIENINSAQEIVSFKKINDSDAALQSEIINDKTINNIINKENVENRLENENIISEDNTIISSDEIQLAKSKSLIERNCILESLSSNKTIETPNETLISSTDKKVENQNMLKNQKRSILNDEIFNCSVLIDQEENYSLSRKRRISTEISMNTSLKNDENTKQRKPLNSKKLKLDSSLVNNAKVQSTEEKKNKDPKEIEIYPMNSEQEKTVIQPKTKCVVEKNWISHKNTEEVVIIEEKLANNNSNNDIIEEIILDDIDSDEDFVNEFIDLSNSESDLHRNKDIPNSEDNTKLNKRESKVVFSNNKNGSESNASKTIKNIEEGTLVTDSDTENCNYSNLDSEISSKRKRKIQERNESRDVKRHFKKLSKTNENSILEAADLNSELSTESDKGKNNRECILDETTGEIYGDIKNENILDVNNEISDEDERINSVNLDIEIMMSNVGCKTNTVIPDAPKKDESRVENLNEEKEAVINNKNDINVNQPKKHITISDLCSGSGNKAIEEDSRLVKTIQQEKDAQIIQLKDVQTIQQNDVQTMKRKEISETIQKKQIDVQIIQQRAEMQTLQQTEKIPIIKSFLNNEIGNRSECFDENTNVKPTEYIGACMIEEMEKHNIFINNDEEDVVINNRDNDNTVSVTKQNDCDERQTQNFGNSDELVNINSSVNYYLNQSTNSNKNNGIISNTPKVTKSKPPPLVPISDVIDETVASDYHIIYSQDPTEKMKRGRPRKKRQDEIYTKNTENNYSIEKYTENSILMHHLTEKNIPNRKKQQVRKSNESQYSFSSPREIHSNNYSNKNDAVIKTLLNSPAREIPTIHPYANEQSNNNPFLTSNSSVRINSDGSMSSLVSELSSSLPNRSNNEQSNLQTRNLYNNFESPGPPNRDSSQIPNVQNEFLKHKSASNQPVSRNPYNSMIKNTLAYERAHDYHILPNGRIVSSTQNDSISSTRPEISSIQNKAQIPQQAIASQYHNGLLRQEISPAYQIPSIQNSGQISQQVIASQYQIDPSRQEISSAYQIPTIQNRGQISQQAITSQYQNDPSRQEISSAYQIPTIQNRGQISQQAIASQYQNNLSRQEISSAYQTHSIQNRAQIPQQAIASQYQNDPSSQETSPAYQITSIQNRAQIPQQAIASQYQNDPSRQEISPAYRTPSFQKSIIPHYQKNSTDTPTNHSQMSSSSQMGLTNQNSRNFVNQMSTKTLLQLNFNPSQHPPQISHHELNALSQCPPSYQKNVGLQRSQSQLHQPSTQALNSPNETLIPALINTPNKHPQPCQKSMDTQSYQNQFHQHLNKTLNSPNATSIPAQINTPPKNHKSYQKSIDVQSYQNQFHQPTNNHQTLIPAQVNTSGSLDPFNELINQALNQNIQISTPTQITLNSYSNQTIAVNVNPAGAIETQKNYTHGYGFSQ